MAQLMDILQILILGLVVGGIPFGVVLAKLFKLPDPRYIGSGNIGATNMLRTGNKKVALLTLLLDALKGAVVVMVTGNLFRLFDSARAAVDGCGIPMNGDHDAFLHVCSAPNLHYAAFALLAAALGHMYSPFLKFKGGKGVATLFGGALAFSWPVGMAGFFVWLIVVFTTRYVSLGSVAALAVAPLICWLRVDGTSALILAAACGLGIWKHRGNLQRVRKGFEPKVSFGRGQK